MTNLTIEDRLQLVQNLYRVISFNKQITDASSPQADSYWITRAILNDTIYSINVRSLMVRVLKKSPVWNDIKQFLENSDSMCGTKGCKGYPHEHKKGTGACTAGGHWRSYADDKKTPCHCEKYTRRPL